MTHFSSDFLEAFLYLWEKGKGTSINENQKEMISKFIGDTVSFNEIKEIIISAIEDNSMPLKLKGEAFFVLGKLHDKSLKYFFIKHLKKEVKKNEEANYDVLYQIMIALDNLEENIFNQKTASVSEKDKNFRDAKAYIDSIKN